MSYLDTEHEIFHESTLFGPALGCEDCAWELKEEEPDETITRCSNDSCQLVMLESVAEFINRLPYCATCALTRQS